MRQQWQGTGSLANLEGLEQLPHLRRMAFLRASRAHTHIRLKWENYSNPSKNKTKTGPTSPVRGQATQHLKGWPSQPNARIDNAIGVDLSDTG